MTTTGYAAASAILPKRGRMQNDAMAAKDLTQLSDRLRDAVRIDANTEVSWPLGLAAQAIDELAASGCACSAWTYATTTTGTSSRLHGPRIAAAGPGGTRSKPRASRHWQACDARLSRRATGTLRGS